MRKLILLFTVLITFLQACDNGRQSLTMVKVLEVGGVKMADKPIVDLLAEQKNIDISLSFSHNQDSIIDLINSHQIDLAIVPNSLDLEYNANIKTITALLPRVLLIIYRGDLGEPKTINELVKGRRVGYENTTDHDLEVFDDLFSFYDVDIEHDFEAIPISDTTADFSNIDIYVSLTHLQNTLVKGLIENGGKIFSLDDPSLKGEGSSVDGFMLAFPKVYPFTLPKQTYTYGPNEPILTIAVQDILISHKDIDDQTAYDIIQTISENRASLTHRNKNYGLLNPDYNSLNTAFAVPLHDGAVHYLNRNVPSFFERYAKLFGIGISIFALLYGIVPQFQKQIRKRRKERADLYYKQLLTLREEFVAGNLNKTEAKKGLVNIRGIAFKHLSKDKLDADESFNILLNLFAQVQDEIDSGIE